MISPEELRKFTFFARQGYYILDEIALISDEVHVKNGECLFQEDTEADRFYIVKEGSIFLTTCIYRGGKVEHLDAMEPIGKGEVLGWSAVVQPYKYRMGALARADSTVIAIEAEPLRHLLEENPENGYLFMKKISELISDRLFNHCIQFLSMITEK